jgi:ABC-type molybdenum transport system ATPase subunit/photorepair protein PhrA
MKLVPIEPKTVIYGQNGSGKYNLIDILIGY